MRRLGLLAGLILTLAIAAPVAAAGGDHTQSFTDNFHGYQTTTGVNPCNGDVVDLSQTSNVVDHVTYFTASDEVWGTYTEEDNFSAMDTGTSVVYTGHATFWGNFNLNRQNSNSTFTGMIHGIGSDGSTISYQETMHFTMLPSGDVAVSFDKVNLTCGS